MAGEEQTNSENDPGVEETTQTNSAPPQQQPTASHEHRNQWIFFGILAGILFGVVLTIAVLRPLIFDRIVPAVMGDFLPADVNEAAPTEDQAAEEAAASEENDDAEDAESGENEVFIPAASGGNSTAAEETAPVEEAVNETGEGETAVTSEPAPEPVTHTVQRGDNLTKIAQQYGVSVPDIMAANNLPNADYISVGQILIIPTN